MKSIKHISGKLKAEILRRGWRQNHRQRWTRPENMIYGSVLTLRAAAKRERLLPR